MEGKLKDEWFVCICIGEENDRNRHCNRIKFVEAGIISDDSKSQTYGETKCGFI